MYANTNFRTKEDESLFADELNLIKEAEAQAEQIKKSAKAEAKSAVEDAGAEAAKLIAEAETKARMIFDTLVSEGNEIAQREYDEAIADAETKANEMEAAAAGKKDEAIEHIVERIVNISVNS